MKVDSPTPRPNGLTDTAGRRTDLVTPVLFNDVKPNNKELGHIEGPLTNDTIGDGILSDASPFSISAVDSDVQDDVSLSFESESDAESSDLDDIVTTGTDVCHAATLEAFLESAFPFELKLLLVFAHETDLEYIPTEVSRLLKLIGTLDEKCEEITELLDRPCDDWFTFHRKKKQKKSIATEESSNGETSQNCNGSKEQMIYRKIYEGQQEIGFETYKAKLARARKQERQKELEMRRNELIALPENEFKIVYEKDNGAISETCPKGHESLTSDMANGSITKNFERQEVQDQQKIKTCSKTSEDMADNFFQTIQQEIMLSGADATNLDFDPNIMGDDWKERLDEILNENRMNQAPQDDMAKLTKFMEEQLSLLWRYTLRKKALSRKLYEMVLHHYASLIQELEPNEFGSSLKCYPEVTVIQNMLLNELEEQYVSPEEMSELYKDVEELMTRCMDEDGYVNEAIPSEMTRCIPFHHKSRHGVCSIAAIVKREESPSAPQLGAETGQRLLMEESFKQNTCATRLPVNGSTSICHANGRNAQGFVEPSSTADARFRSVRNNRHKSTKAPSGMSHAAKSPQSTGRLLTYHDIVTTSDVEKLRGRLAELFWPHDDLWYLIRIDAIHPETKQANIVYMTGETENLDLNDIVREGHMSLLPEAEDTDLSADEEGLHATADLELGEEIISELSASEMRDILMDEGSPEEDEICTEDDEEEAIANIHRNRQSRRAELKTENVQRDL